VLGGVLTFTPSSKNPGLSVVGSGGTPAPSAPGRGASAKGAAGSKKKPGNRRSGSFMQRMEERWDKRREQD
jgi:hypothetical protein